MYWGLGISLSLLERVVGQLLLTLAPSCSPGSCLLSPYHPPRTSILAGIWVQGQGGLRSQPVVSRAVTPSWQHHSSFNGWLARASLLPPLIQIPRAFWCRGCNTLGAFICCGLGWLAQEREGDLTWLPSFLMTYVTSVWGLVRGGQGNCQVQVHTDLASPRADLQAAQRLWTHPAISPRSFESIPCLGKAFLPPPNFPDSGLCSFLLTSFVAPSRVKPQNMNCIISVIPHTGSMFWYLHL